MLLLQTCVVVAISVFGATLPAVYQCVLFTAAFGMAFLLLAIFRPFSHHRANVIGLQSLACLILTAQAALVVATLASTDVEAAYTAAAVAVCVVAICVNVLFALSFGVQLLLVVDWAAISKAMGSTASKLGCGAESRRGGCLAGKGP